MLAPDIVRLFELLGIDIQNSAAHRTRTTFASNLRFGRGDRRFDLAQCFLAHAASPNFPSLRCVIGVRPSCRPVNRMQACAAGLGPIRGPNVTLFVSQPPNPWPPPGVGSARADGN